MAIQSRKGPMDINLIDSIPKSDMEFINLAYGALANSRMKYVK
jgi:hypothetical protein